MESLSNDMKEIKNQILYLIKLLNQEEKKLIEMKKDANEFKDNFNYKLEELEELDNNKSSVSCKHFLCFTRSCFNYIGSSNALYCGTHKKTEMIDVVSKKCTEKGCLKQPVYNFPKEKKGIRCKQHKLNGMVNVKDKKCIEIGCFKIPCCNYPGKSKPLYCAKHKLSNMINIMSKKCIEKNCQKIAIYNFPDKITKLYCSIHKKEKMVVIYNEICTFENCNKRACFNFFGQKKGLRCKQHIENGMINVKHAKCTYDGCNTFPVYNFPKEKKGIRCKQHKLNGMVNVKDKKCIVESCDKNPIFNIKGEKEALFCNQHKLIDMVDVKNKRCNIEGCEKRAYYGLLFKGKRHCPDHRHPNEFKNCFPKCEIDDCDINPYYTDDPENPIPKRCEKHKEKDDINIIERKCESCNLEFYLNEDNFCDNCSDFIKISPERKEHKVKKYLEKRKIVFQSHDKIITDGCSRYRADLLIRYEYFNLIIEVDEFQHKNYEKECEISRMKQIFYDIGEKKALVFIRYNPDEYKDSNEKIIKPNNDYRLRQLYCFICYLKKSYNGKEPKNKLTVNYMFYDGMNEKYRCEIIKVI